LKPKNFTNNWGIILWIAATNNNTRNAIFKRNLNSRSLEALLLLLDHLFTINGDMSPRGIIDA